MSKENIGPTHYRLNDHLYEQGVTVVLEKFRVIKKTPKGYWVLSQYGPSWLSPEDLIKRKYAKWVSATSTKRYCYPTVELAASSFRRRKEVQMDRLQHQLDQARHVVSNLDSVTSNEKDYAGYGLNLGMPEQFRHITFE